jgi:hypothetical protein
MNIPKKPLHPVLTDEAFLDGPPPSGTAPAAAPPGRPSTCTADKLHAICAFIRTTGLSDTAAAALVQVTRSTLSRWKQEDEEVQQELDVARAQFQMPRLEKIGETRMKDGQYDWRAQAWLVKFANPEVHGAPSRRRKLQDVEVEAEGPRTPEEWQAYAMTHGREIFMAGVEGWRKFEAVGRGGRDHAGDAVRAAGAAADFSEKDGGRRGSGGGAGERRRDAGARRNRKERRERKGGEARRGRKGRTRGDGRDAGGDALGKDGSGGGASRRPTGPWLQLGGRRWPQRCGRVGRLGGGGAEKRNNSSRNSGGTQCGAGGRS